MNYIVITKGLYRQLTAREKNRNPMFEYVIVRPYQLKINGKSISVTRGFLTDGSSGGPDVGTAWIFHDYLYSTHMYDDGSYCSQDEADKIMRDVLMFEGYKLYAFCYKIVNYLFKYKFTQAYESSKKRGRIYLL
jgi:hypothetical protein